MNRTRTHRPGPEEGRIGASRCKTYAIMCVFPYIFEKSRQYIIKSGRDLFFSLFAVAVVRRRSHIDPGTLAGAEPAANPQQKNHPSSNVLVKFPNVFARVYYDSA